MKAYAQTYCTIKIEDLDLIDFDQVFETSADTIRIKLDLTLFLIKYNTEPTFITDGTVIPEGTYTHSEILVLMRSPEWNGPPDEE